MKYSNPCFTMSFVAAFVATVLLSACDRERLADSVAQQTAVDAKPSAPACIAEIAPVDYVLPDVQLGDEATTLAQATSSLAVHRIILIGEQHDRLDHHLNQLEIICRLNGQGVPLAVGLEAFDQPFQPALDAYIAREIDFVELLERSEYYSRWGFDHRLYAPLIKFAWQHNIPLVALNIPRQRSRRIASHGGRLETDDHAFFPYGLASPGPAYKARVEGFFRLHPQAKDADLARFVLVQWQWDQAMGQRAARFLASHPTRTLVVIAGSGHVAYADALPHSALRAARAAGFPLSIGRVLHRNRTVKKDASDAKTDAHAEHTVMMLNPTYSAQLPLLRDVVLVSSPLGVPPSGRLGVFLESVGGDVVVKSLAPKSAAGAAGIQAGDRIVKVGEQFVSSYLRVKLALAQTQPAQKVTVEVLRKGQSKPLRYDVELH
ncbi:MAG: putative iron-regulated protein [Gammaproteobacteria bacterium]|jgi:uncharacterized iron-regulated protein